MDQLNEVEMGETYEFVIEQRGSRYTAVITVDAPMSSITETVVGQVEESTYPTGGWEGLNFRIHKDGTVEDMRGNPFGPIGEVVDIKKVE